MIFDEKSTLPNHDFPGGFGFFTIVSRKNVVFDCLRNMFVRGCIRIRRGDPAPAAERSASGARRTPAHPGPRGPARPVLTAEAGSLGRPAPTLESSPDVLVVAQTILWSR